MKCSLLMNTLLQPDRIYYLDDVEKQAITWVDAIQQIQRIVSGQT